jgi:tRNA(Ser,Leu) C12 N-acetylase TAN1
MLFGYGKELLTRVHPDGSVEQTETTIRNWDEVSTKTEFQHRVMVHNDDQILAEFIKFRKDHKDDGHSFYIENTTKGMYIVKCWTVKA